VLVDAGDILHGTALSNLTEGRTSIDFFNLLAPDASVIGNHEFDWGVEALRQRIAEARFPLLLANVETRATGERPPWARAYEIVERRGVRIAIVGVVTETLAEEILAEHVAAHRFTDPVATARETIAGLVPSRADLAVVVCHCGLSEGDIFGTEVKELAAGLPGVAAIVAGHTHERHALRLSGVPVVQPGFGGRYLARVDLSYDPRARTVTGGEVEILPVWADSQALAPEAVRRIEGYHDEVGTILAEELGTAAVDLDQDPNGECRLGNLLTDVIRDRFGVDMAFQNALGVRAPIASGTVRFSDVYGALIPSTPCACAATFTP
jgi:2',3'-cyclic-nucleotide 2'-phosphodiesterase/3'-nucleotidase